MSSVTAGVEPVISLPLSKRGLLVAIWGVYTIQGQLGGITFVTLPAILRAKSVPMEQISLFSAIILIWAGKFVWAGIVERWRLEFVARYGFGRTILLVELLIIGLIAGSSFLPLTSIYPFLALFSCAAFLASIIDIACDGYLIAHFPASLRRLGATAQVGGGYLGFALGGSFLPAFYAKAGWPVSCLVMIGSMIMLSTPLLVLTDAHSPLKPHRVGSDAPRWRPNLIWALKRPEIRTGIIMIIVFDAARRMTQGLGALYLLGEGVSLPLIGALNGALGIGAGLLGTFLGNLCVRKFGSSAALSTFAVVTCGLLLAVTFAIQLGRDGIALLTILIFVESLLMAGGFVILFSRVMGFTSLQQPGLDFALFQSVSAAIAAVAGFAGTMIAGKAGFGIAFACATCLALAAIPTLKLLQKPSGEG